MADATENRDVLLTGATGFVGHSLYPDLVEAGHLVRCTTRDVHSARQRWPHRRWVEMDVEREESVHKAMRGCRAAYYLVHRMADTPDYEEQEARAAMTFLEAATEAGVERIVYLGGVKPAGKPAHHLRSRLVTGAILRSGEISTVELRASMIVGHGSASWQIVRDLALRLPVMLCPRWLENRTQPVAIDDARDALVAALQLELEQSAIYPIPGPEVLSFRECIERVCELVGNRPKMINVPVLTPRLSGYWLRLVTGANYHVARALAEGLKDDLVVDNDEYWELIGQGPRIGFNTAARQALAGEKKLMNQYERAIHTLVDRRRSSPR